MIMTSRVFENLPFHSPHNNDDRSTFSEVSTFKSFFENLRFRGPPFLKTSFFDRFSVNDHIQTKVFENGGLRKCISVDGPLVKVLEVVKSHDSILTTYLTNGKRPMTIMEGLNAN